MPTIEAHEYTGEIKKLALIEREKTPPQTISVGEFQAYLREHRELFDNSGEYAAISKIDVPPPVNSNSAPKLHSTLEPTNMDDFNVWEGFVNTGGYPIVEIAQANLDDSNKDSIGAEIPSHNIAETRRRIFGIEFARSQGFIGKDTAEEMLRKMDLPSDVNEIAAVIPDVKDNELVNDDKLIGLIESIMHSKRERLYTVQSDVLTKPDITPESKSKIIVNKKNYLVKNEERDDTSTDKERKASKIKNWLTSVADSSVEKLNNITQPTIEAKTFTENEPGTAFEIITDKVLGKEGVKLDDETLLGLRGLAIRIVQYIKKNGVPPKKSTREMFASVLVAVGMLIPNGLLAKMNDKPDANKNAFKPPAAAFGFAPTPFTTETTEQKVEKKFNFLPKELPELGWQGEAKKGEIIDFLMNHPENIIIYKIAERESGVPWPILAAKHYREGGMNPNKSLISGRDIGKPEPDQDYRTYGSLLETAIHAGEILKSKVERLENFDDYVKALSRYNGGGNNNCGHMELSICNGPKGSGDPYVMTGWGVGEFEELKVRYCEDGIPNTKGCPRSDEKPGVLTVARIIATHPEYENFGIPKPGEIFYPPNLGEPNELGYYQMPESKNGLWRFLTKNDNFSEFGKGSADTCSAQRWAKKETIGVLYTASIQMALKHPNARVVIADLNADGHASHGAETSEDPDNSDGGIDFDIYLEDGALDSTNKEKFNEEQATDLNIFLAKTGNIRLIFYNHEGVQVKVNNFIKQNNLAGEMVFVKNHDKHPHGRITGEGGPTHTPSC